MNTWFESFAPISLSQLIAMVRYANPLDGFLDGIQSGRLFETNLMTVFFISVPLFVILMKRSAGSAQPYFSRTFFLALCPFISCALVAFIRLHRIMDSSTGIAFQDNLREIARPFNLGVVVSFLLIGIYSMTYRRQIENASAQRNDEAANPPVAV